MKRKPITILGGGIAGLAAALALEKTGHQVKVLERAKAFDPIGAGIQLGPNAVRALRKIGAWDAVAPITSSPPAMDIRSAISGRLLNSVILGPAFEQRFGEPYRIAHRADLHEALIMAIRQKPAVTVKMGQAVDARKIKGPVIAADGIWSTTREALFPGSAPMELPVTIWRALIDMPTVKGVNMNALNFWLDEGCHIIHYPVAHRGKLNVVGVAKAPGPHAAFAKASALLRALLTHMPHFTQWRAAIVNPLPCWHQGNILLIGDAAHGTVPWLAQGGAMSLEDAAALMETTDPKAYYALRFPRTLRLHEQTLATGKLYHLAGLQRLARDFVLRTRSQEKLIERNGWIYRGP